MTRPGIEPRSPEMASVSTILGLPYLACSREISSPISLLYSDQLCFFTVFFGCFSGVMARSKPEKYKFPLHVHLCSFQITHQVKQCTTYQRTNKHDTTKAQVPELDYIACPSVRLSNHTQRVKQCTTCQGTNYHDTTNHKRYFYTAWTSLVTSNTRQKLNLYQKYCGAFSHPIKIHCDWFSKSALQPFF